MFVNAALNRPGAEPGKGYPSAGPLPHLMDIWKAAGKSIDFLSPDFYNPDFKYWNDLYTRQNNPLFIPEHRFDSSVAAKAAFAIGLWVGWMGFNPGSFLNAIGANFADVAVNTNLATAAGVIGATVSALLLFKTLDVSQMGNGALAALVAITAPCAFVDAWAAVVIGVIAGLIVPPLVLLVDKLFKIDDPVGTLPVHGISQHVGHPRVRLVHHRRPRGLPRGRPGRSLRRRRRTPALGPVLWRRRDDRVHLHGVVHRLRGRSSTPWACASARPRSCAAWTSRSTGCSATRSASSTCPAPSRRTLR